ncbi:hypothetical protein A7C99_0613 [Trichophyton rubrum]|uniref:Uncharacterized protein n=1 Tax=Trichophyton rubrum TaxID=5551 RepID=A0A178F9G6_TRIRU|nr:hypothetical protein A7C99_0613 [Trichophyton rubrum]
MRTKRTVEKPSGRPGLVDGADERLATSSGREGSIKRGFFLRRLKSMDRGRGERLAHLSMVFGSCPGGSEGGRDRTGCETEREAGKSGRAVQSIRFMATPYFWLLVDGCWLLDLLAGPAYGATSQRLIASTTEYLWLPLPSLCLSLLLLLLLLLVGLAGSGGKIILAEPKTSVNIKSSQDGAADSKHHRKLRCDYLAR